MEKKKKNLFYNMKTVCVRARPHLTLAERLSATAPQMAKCNRRTVNSSAKIKHYYSRPASSVDT